MPETNPLYEDDLYSKKERSLRNSLHILKQQWDKKDEAEGGLSKSFLNDLQTIEDKLLASEKAMKRLCEEYVKAMFTFRDEKNPIQSLEALNQAEKVWSEASPTIQTHSPNGDEKEFLKTIREHSFKTLEQKLETIPAGLKGADLGTHKTLALGIIATMDKILSEEDVPENSAHRKRLSDIAKNLL